MNTSVSYRKVTRSAIKEQLLSNVWSIVITLSVYPILLLLRWLLGTNFIFEVNGSDILDKISAGQFVWIAPVGFVVIFITAFVAWITSIVSGATARTYLGAGMSRRAILTMNMKVWLASAAFMTLVATVALLAHFIIIGDFSGNVAPQIPEGIDIPFTFPGTVLWWAPLATFLLMLYAHSAGYFIALVFVRLPWWIPVGIFVIIAVIGPALFGFGINVFDWKDFLVFSHPMATFVAQTSLEIVILTALNWLLISRLPIRR
ncbi:MAG: hypothetical protein QM705_14150 [Ancrocorticia sp.]